MSHERSDAPPLPPLDLDGLPLWLVERGMLGLPAGEQIAGFCRKVFDSGFPMKRVQMGMYTLHLRYGSHTFVWRPGADAIEHIPRERAIQSHDVYLKSPVHHMRSRGLLALRRRLDTGDTDEFVLFPELRAEGLVDYTAHVVPYDPSQAEVIAKGLGVADDTVSPDGALDGIFFSCATDRPEGFDDGQLNQVVQAQKSASKQRGLRQRRSVLEMGKFETYRCRSRGNRRSGRLLAGSLRFTRKAVKQLRSVSFGSGSSSAWPARSHFEHFSRTIAAGYSARLSDPLGMG